MKGVCASLAALVGILLAVSSAAAIETTLIVPVQLSALLPEVTRGAIRCRVVHHVYNNPLVPENMKTILTGESQFPIDPKTGSYSGTALVKVSWQLQESKKSNNIYYTCECYLRLSNAAGTWADLDVPKLRVSNTSPAPWAKPWGKSMTYSQGYLLKP